MLERRENPRTHYIHRISYSAQERIVGSFVLIAISILIWLLFSSGNRDNLFAENFILYGKMEAAQAVDVDTEVQVSGITVGHVSSVDITDSNEIVLTMEMLDKYHNLLREDSVATFKSLSFAVIGKSSIEITPGTPDKPILEAKSTIVITESLSMKNIMEKVTPSIVAIEESIQKLNKLLSAIDPDKLEQTMDNFNKISKDVNSMTTKMRTEEGAIGRAIYNKEFDANIQAVVTKFKTVATEMNKLVSDIKGNVDNVPELLEKMGPLLNEADKTIKATQRIWPLSSAVESENATTETLTAPGPANE